MVTLKKMCPCPNPRNLWTLPYLENQILADVIKDLEKRSSWSGWALNSMTNVLTKDTERRRGPIKMEANWSDAATSHGTPRDNRSRRARGSFSPPVFSGKAALLRP